MNECKSNASRMPVSLSRRYRYAQSELALIYYCVVCVACNHVSRLLSSRLVKIHVRSIEYMLVSRSWLPCVSVIGNGEIFLVPPNPKLHQLHQLLLLQLLQ
jgi:hypothetical protein